MSVTSVNYLMHSTQDAAIDDRGRATYTTKFLVETDSNMGPASVVNGAQNMSSGLKVPGLWDTYSYPMLAEFPEVDYWSFCRDIRAAKESDLANGGQKWIVTTTHRALDPGEEKEDSTENPVLRPAKFHWDKEVYREEVSIAQIYQQKTGETVSDSPWQGNGLVEIRNTAGGLYERPFEVVKTRSVLVITKNYQTLNDVLTKTTTFQGKINNSDWKIGANGPTVLARHALCREVTSSPMNTEPKGDGYSWTFYTLVFRISLNDKPWVESVPERGRSYWVPDVKAGEDARELTPADDRDFVKLEYTENGEFVNLDADGKKQFHQEKRHLSDAPPDPCVTDWLVYPEANFATMPVS